MSSLVILKPLSNKNQISESLFWKNRLSTLLDYITNKCNDDQIIVLTDTFDSLIIQSPDQFISKYKMAFGSKVVFGGEMLCETTSCRLDHILKSKIIQLNPNEDAPSKFLNAGQVVGNRQGLLHIMRCAYDLMNELIDDQTALTQCVTMKDNQANYVIDARSVLFASVPSVFGEDASYIPSNIHNVLYPNNNNMDESVPTFIHFPGMRYDPSSRYTTSCSYCGIKLIHLYNLVGEKRLSKPPLPPSLQLLQKMPRVVVSLTTVPSRLLGLLPTIKSIVNQNMKIDAIYLNIPVEMTQNPTYQTFLMNIKSSYSVIINTCFDYGPATKLIPILDLETQHDTLIFTADDDMIYQPTTIYELIRVHLKYPFAAFGYAGQNIDDDGVVRSADNWLNDMNGIDIIEAFLGVIYRRDFFDDRLKVVPSVCRSCDDIWISSHLAEKGIPRIKLPIVESKRPSFSANDQVTPLRSLNVFGKKKNNICAEYLLSSFKKTWNDEPQSCSIMFQSLIPCRAPPTTNHNHNKREDDAMSEKLSSNRNYLQTLKNPFNENMNNEDISQSPSSLSYHMTADIYAVLTPNTPDWNPDYLISQCGPMYISTLRNQNNLPIGGYLNIFYEVFSSSKEYSLTLSQLGQLCIKRYSRYRQIGSVCYPSYPVRL
eukprot:gene17525-24293_t